LLSSSGFHSFIPIRVFSYRNPFCFAFDAIFDSSLVQSNGMSCVANHSFVRTGSVGSR